MGDTTELSSAWLVVRAKIADIICAPEVDPAKGVSVKELEKQTGIDALKLGGS